MGTGGQDRENARREARRLRHEIEQALSHAPESEELVHRLERLSRIATPASPEAVFAHRKLAEVLVARYPWRAALYAKRALAHDSIDDRSWATLAFAHTLLGHYRSAAAAYQRALACAPSNPWYAHNLGHLLDVALHEPERALRWLRQAYQAKGDNSEIVASYAHALAVARRTEEATKVLDQALARFASEELLALKRWVAGGAPTKRGSARAPTTREAPRARAGERQIVRQLSKGLSRLPLDEIQRERAMLLARDIAVVDRAARALPVADMMGADREPSPSEGPIDARRSQAGMAAALAYAVVYVDQMPLSQAEVAASFRVGVRELRARFAEIRAKLDLIRGDVRYTTLRSR